MENTKIRSLKNVQEYSTNPFIEDMIKIDGQYFKAHSRREKSLRTLGDIETGEVYSAKVEHGVTLYFWQDTCKFTKIFNTSYAFNKILNLTLTARHLLDYVCSVLLPNKDYVKVTFKDYSSKVGNKNKSSFYGGLSELCVNGILAKCSGGVFFINPLVLINGQRVEFLEDPETFYEQQRKIDSGQSIHKSQQDRLLKDINQEMKRLSQQY